MRAAGRDDVTLPPVTSRRSALHHGAAAPETRVANGDLEAVVETSDEWISQRTGIRSRHLMKPGEVRSSASRKIKHTALQLHICSQLRSWL